MKKTTRHSLLSLLLALILVMTAFSGLSVSASADEAQSEVTSPLNKQGLVTAVEGGAILHCWCWSFNAIKENIPRIAEAGYSAVQTSPINEIYSGNDAMNIYSDETGGKWYYAYQPTDLTIGNYMLGSEDEFKAMCAKAHEYGVKIIVDVVANHTTPMKGAVAASLKNISGGLYHNNGTGSDERYNTTQWYSGLPDINTQNPVYQQLVLSFLKKCVADGADGFRYDTAKHIELPDDDPSYASDFWPTVLDNGSTFQYGEVLQGTNSAETKAARLSSYAEIMHVTASKYGNKLRDYFLTNTGTAVVLKSYDSEGVSADRLVTWVESHDTYANGGSKNVSTSYWMSNAQVRRGWALIASRGDTTCLFFSRPDGSIESDDSEREGSTIWGKNILGAAGDDNYFNPEVAAVNHFRNAMIGEKTNMINLKGIEGTKRYTMITRGDKGAVIVNNNDTNDLAVNQEVTMPDGVYTDEAHGGKFTVKGGVLTGEVKAGTVAVIYGTPEPLPEEPTEAPTEAPTVAPETSVQATIAKSKIYVGATTTVKPDVENPVGDISFQTSNKSVATVSSKGVVKGVGAGTAKITVTNNGKSATVTVKVVKKDNTMTVKTAAKAVSFSKLKKAKQTVAPITVKTAKGTVVYKKLSGSSKLSLTSSGKVVIKKGTKKGTYTAKVKVTAKGTTAYLSASKTVKITVKVK